MTAQRVFARPITLDTLPDLFAHNRRLFGGWRMEDAGGEGGDGGDKGDKGGDGGKGDGFTAPASQADLDRIIQERVARERAKYADYNDMKAKAEAHDKALADAKTDAEKAIDAARAEGEKSALGRANTVLVSAEARALAAEAKFRNPGLAVQALDLADVRVGDDGTVDADALKAKLKALADSDPYLIDDGKTGGPRKDPSQGGGTGEQNSSVANGRKIFEDRQAQRPKSGGAGLPAGMTAPAN